MHNPNECGMTTCLHLRGAGPLSILVQEIPDRECPSLTRYVVNIGAGVRMQEVGLFLDAGQLVQLAGALATWAQAIEDQRLVEDLKALDGPQQYDDLVDVRGGK